MTFYWIECLLFSLMLSVLGVGNYKLEGKFRETWFDYPTEPRCYGDQLVEVQTNFTK